MLCAELAKKTSCNVSQAKTHPFLRVVPMNRDAALRLDGIVSGVRCQLDWLAHASKENLDDQEFEEIAAHIGIAMGAIYEISKYIYHEFPDAVPAALRPGSFER